MEKRGSKWRFVNGWEKGKNDGFSTVSYMKSTDLMGTTMRILDRGMRPFKSLQEPTIFSSDKICSLEAQKFLVTFWYNKYYRWLTVAPLGDGAFLKASKTSDFDSLGGWPVPHPLGCPSFTEMIFFEKILAAIKKMDLSSTSFLPTQSYRSNIFSSFRVHLDWQTLFQHFILLKKTRNLI